MRIILFLLVALLSFSASSQNSLGVTMLEDSYIQEIDPFFDNVELLKKEELDNYELYPNSARNADLQFRIAVSYDLGTVNIDDVPIGADKKKAVLWYKKAVNAKHARAMVALAKLYKNAGSVSKALRLFSDATKIKDNPEPYAFFEMGLVYELGIGRFTNPERALKFYNQAVEFKVIDAMLKLASWYETGTNVVTDYHHAISLYEGVIVHSDDQSLQKEISAKIASLYGLIAYDDENVGEKITWLLKAAEAGNVDSYIRVARLYQDGESVPMDMDRAIFWYKKATSAGIVYAMEVLGYIYANGLNEVPEDYCEAKKWYLSAAEQGSADAAWNIANFYLNGFCVEIDKKQSDLWFIKMDKLRVKRDAAYQERQGRY